MQMSDLIDDLTQKQHYLRSLFGQMLPRNSVTMATPKVSGDQNLFERVCYMLTLFVPEGLLGTPPQFFRHNSQSFRANSSKFGDFS